jgi:hypothetical protein
VNKKDPNAAAIGEGLGLVETMDNLARAEKIGPVVNAAGDLVAT